MCVVLTIGAIVSGVQSLYLPENYAGNTDEQLKGVTDLTFKWTEGLNIYFLDHKDKRDALLIASALLMDSLVFLSFYRFVRYGTTFRLFICLILFYGVRALCQAIYIQSKP